MGQISRCDTAIVYVDAYLIVHALDVVHRELGRGGDETFEPIHLEVLIESRVEKR